MRGMQPLGRLPGHLFIVIFSYVVTSFGKRFALPEADGVLISDVPASPLVGVTLPRGPSRSSSWRANSSSTALSNSSRVRASARQKLPAEALLPVRKRLLTLIPVNHLPGPSHPRVLSHQPLPPLSSRDHAEQHTLRQPQLTQVRGKSVVIDPLGRDVSTAAAVTVDGLPRHIEALHDSLTEGVKSAIAPVAATQVTLANLSRSWRMVAWIEGLPPLPAHFLAEQADIWSSRADWLTMRQWHPVSVISRVSNGTVLWTTGSYVSWSSIVGMSFICYPVLFIAIAFLMTCVISASLRETPPVGLRSAAILSGAVERFPAALEDGVRGDPLFSPPVLAEEHFTPLSRKIYRTWVAFCRLLPAMLVFGVPLMVVFFSTSLPQEVFITLSLFVSTMVFSNGVYLVVFTSSAILQMKRAMSVDYGAKIGVPTATRFPLASGVTHWVIVPQYREDVEVVSAMLRSISVSNIAKASINICLAMEEREDNVQVKVEALKSMFQHRFAEILVSYHPPGLKNHPPGKASNTTWAYMVLIQHLRRNGMDMSKVILTVSDADSEFHKSYFEGLTHSYLEMPPDKRDMCIWQSPILHLKNYHRQPFLVAIGTMFTCLQDLALLADPNTVRFPYSTYSLSLTLTRCVGGWDPQWIAEDWHMGIKCFIFTGGRSFVEPLLLPTVNFTPEESTWWKTISARWVQAKRHALGFSDFMYFFSMLPLFFGYTASTSRKGGYLPSLSASLRVFLGGIPVIIKFINVHMILGVLTPYSSITFLLKSLMYSLMDNDRDVGYLVKSTDWSLMVMLVGFYISLMFTFGLFVGVYELVRERIDGEPYRSSVVHFFAAICMFVLFGPGYFFMLGCAVWRAVLGVMTSDTFEYEVAPKPSKTNMMGETSSSGMLT